MVISIHCNTKKQKCQDRTLHGELANKWTPKKMYSLWLSDVYMRLGYRGKSLNVAECGSFLEFCKPVPSVDAFAANTSQQGSTSDGWKLQQANFCRDRLCPMCQWRRTLKVFSQVSRIMDVIGADNNFLFLTLTVPNCSGRDLSVTIDKIQKAWDRFTHYKKYKNAVNGYFKALEITYNSETDTYHPHLHIILSVDPDYFTSDKYIDQSSPNFEWTKMWQKALKSQKQPIVDVRRVKPKNAEGERAVKSLASAVAEVSKYSVKSSDYLRKDINCDKVVNTLMIALSGRRLCSFGGLFENVRKALKLDDYEDGDLIHIDGTEMRQDVAYMIRRYNWSCGSYKLLDVSTVGSNEVNEYEMQY